MCKSTFKTFHKKLKYIYEQFYNHMQDNIYTATFETSFPLIKLKANMFQREHNNTVNFILSPILNIYSYPVGKIIWKTDLIWNLPHDTQITATRKQGETFTAAYITSPQVSNQATTNSRFRHSHQNQLIYKDVHDNINLNCSECISLHASSQANWLLMNEFLLIGVLGFQEPKNKCY